MNMNADGDTVQMPVTPGTLHARDELVKSICNRCQIYLILRKQTVPHELEHLLPTLLEDIYLDAQTLLDDFCVVRQ